MDQLKLEDINPHPRDKNITFTEKGLEVGLEKDHIYTIKDVKEIPVSTTETIGKYHEHFNADKILDKMFPNGVEIYNGKNESYIGKTREEIKFDWEQAGPLGTAMHQDIENFFNGDPVENPDCKEHQMFLSFWGDYLEKNPTHRPYRTEWLIYDDSPNCKKVLAGSIDFVVVDENGDLYIFDWKRAREIKKENRYESKSGLTICKKMFKQFNDLDDCNYNHYRLQLNFYRHVLETLYDKKVKSMTLIILHPNQEKYEPHNLEKYDLSEIWHTLR